MAISLTEDKLMITVGLTGNMKDHFLLRLEELGLKKTELIRKFIAEDMEKCKLNDRPQIIYYGAETTFPSKRPLPEVVTRRKPQEMTAMMSTNSEMKRLIEATGGNPRLALKKVIRSEV